MRSKPVTERATQGAPRESNPPMDARRYESARRARGSREAKKRAGKRKAKGKAKSAPKRVTKKVCRSEASKGGRVLGIISAKSNKKKLTKDSKRIVTTKQQQNRAGRALQRGRQCNPGDLPTLTQYSASQVEKDFWNTQIPEDQIGYGD